MTLTEEVYGGTTTVSIHHQQRGLVQDNELFVGMDKWIKPLAQLKQFTNCIPVVPNVPNHQIPLSILYLQISISNTRE